MVYIKNILALEGLIHCYLSDSLTKSPFTMITYRKMATLNNDMLHYSRLEQTECIDQRITVIWLLHEFA